MADLTSNASLRILGDLHALKFFLDTSAAQHIYKGQPLIIDASVDTTRVCGYVDATVVDPADVFVGIAQHEIVVAAGDTEDVEASSVLAAVGPSIEGFKSTVFTMADIGKAVYMSDSGTLSVTAADNPYIGKLKYVFGGYCYVELTAPQICTGA
jgi:hypothetical protein